MNNGLGKTLQLITLARYRKEHQGLKHCLIICGINSLKWNWRREVAKFCKNEKAIVLGTRKNTKGKIVPITIEETKTQIDSCPEEFFWIINIERIRLTDKKSKDNIIDHINTQIEKGNLGMIAIDEIHKCLEYNTLVKTDIGELKIGDIVTKNIDCNILTYNENTKILEWQPIINRFEVKNSKPIVEIKTSSKSLKCSIDHKIYTLNRGWIEAGNLEVEDEVILVD